MAQHPLKDGFNPGIVGSTLTPWDPGNTGNTGQESGVINLNNNLRPHPPGVGRIEEKVNWQYNEWKFTFVCLKDYKNIRSLIIINILGQYLRPSRFPDYTKYTPKLTKKVPRDPTWGEIKKRLETCRN